MITYGFTYGMNRDIDWKESPYDRQTEWQNLFVPRAASLAAFIFWLNPGGRVRTINTPIFP